MTHLKLPKKVKISDNVLFQHLNNECVLLDMASEQYFGLNDVGARIWQILSEGDGDAEKTLSLLLSEYETDEATLRADLINLLTELGNEKLIIIEN
ncbi:PqqD family protein [Mucilaginibacter sp. L3T2-6]|uniref:PqqD family protein n=1 Tax=Mucilaginibacter sp. L3T2-6 TaxID=3062491 RepID=UPI0026776221|nr:PqqD family protein [Mucilaginibacter sp. L3T2-6]MDO3642248.1 PqqD family protein [Mucilaginibacter sp. L3T2-6]MDV6214743.1 PqqD family protein [Mucilaginibacter sp. L3T2-6]